MTTIDARLLEPFNGAIETGLRALVVLVEAFPTAYSMERLVMLDYLVVHSDDIPGGPVGLHPKTPNRSGELLVRRSLLQRGLFMYESRGLVVRIFSSEGLRYGATERSGAFVDGLQAPYVALLRASARWAVEAFGGTPEGELSVSLHSHLGQWGAEFEREPVSWVDEP